MVKTGKYTYMYIYIYIYIYMYICIICLVRAYSVYTGMYIHPAPFVRDAIFPHRMLVYVTTVAQETRLAGQKAEQWEPI